MNDTNNGSGTDALLAYYRNRASDLEFEFLQYQLESTRKIKELEQQLAAVTDESAQD